MGNVSHHRKWRDPDRRPSQIPQYAWISRNRRSDCSPTSKPFRPRFLARCDHSSRRAIYGPVGNPNRLAGDGRLPPGFGRGQWRKTRDIRSASIRASHRWRKGCASRDPVCRIETAPAACLSPPPSPLRDRALENGELRQIAIAIGPITSSSKSIRRIAPTKRETSAMGPPARHSLAPRWDRAPASHRRRAAACRDPKARSRPQSGNPPSSRS